MLGLRHNFINYNNKKIKSWHWVLRSADIVSISLLNKSNQLAITKETLRGGWLKSPVKTFVIRYSDA